MTDKEKKERDALTLEINARKDVLKKLENPLKRLQAQADKNLQKRKDKIDAAKAYASVEEARELWGYDAISEDDLHEVERFFEEGEEFIEKQISSQEYAVRILGDFISRLHSEIRSFEFELLSPEEQERIRNENAKLFKRKNSL